MPKHFNFIAGRLLRIRLLRIRLLRGMLLRIRLLRIRLLRSRLLQSILTLLLADYFEVGYFEADYQRIRRMINAKMIACRNTPPIVGQPGAFRKLGSPIDVQMELVRLYVPPKKIKKARIPKKMANHHFMELVTVGRYVLTGAAGVAGLIGLPESLILFKID